MEIIIDRIEGDFAVCETEDKKTVNVPLCILPDAKEGDVVKITISHNDQRSQNIKNLMDNLFEE